MAVYIVSDKVEELPPALAKQARLDGSRYWVAEGTEGFKVENAEGLRNAVATERKHREAAERIAKKYGWSIGEDGTIADRDGRAIDPELATELIGKHKAGKLEANGAAKDTAKAIEEMRAEYDAKYARDKAELDLERKEMQAQLHEEFIQNRGREAIKAADGDDKTVTALLGVIEKQARLEKGPNGKLRAVLYSPDGKQLISRKSGSADPMGLEEFAKTLREDPAYKRNFPLTRPGGSGASHTGGGSASSGVNGQAGGDEKPMTGKALLALGLQQALRT